jgi:peptidoglycan/xylan/chitin deacetylase (PgdA/CDA1 family)
MLNFRNTNIFFLIVLAIFIPFQIKAGLSILWYLLILFLYLSLLFYGSYYVCSGFFMRVLCKGNTLEKQIAITFDDGPMENYTPQILDILKSFGVQAAFFCIGERAKENIQLLKRIHQEGHDIGSHSFSHSFWYDLLPANKMLSDLQKTHQLVLSELGITLKWFRPPYGVTNPNLRKAVSTMGYSTIGWSVRSLDTVQKDSGKLFGKMKIKLKPGAVYLFHDTSQSTAEMLPMFLEFVKEQEYEVVSLHKLLHLPD